MLTEHPEIEFVQITLNPIDWGSEPVQVLENTKTVNEAQPFSEDELLTPRQLSPPLCICIKLRKL